MYSWRERVYSGAVVRRGPQLGGLRDDRAPLPAAEVRVSGLLLPHLQGAEGRRQGREHQGNPTQENGGQDQEVPGTTGPFK